MMRRDGRSLVASFLSPHTLWNRTSANVLKPLSAKRAPIPPFRPKSLLDSAPSSSDFVLYQPAPPIRYGVALMPPGNANTRLPLTLHMVTSGPELFPDRLL